MNEREKAERQSRIIVRVFSVIAIALIVFAGMYKYQHTFSSNNWANNPVYPIQRGEDDSAGLKVENYKIN